MKPLATMPEQVQDWLFKEEANIDNDPDELFMHQNKMTPTTTAQNIQNFTTVWLDSSKTVWEAT